MLFAGTFNPKLSCSKPSDVLLAILLILENSFDLDSKSVLKSSKLVPKDENADVQSIEEAVQEICVAIEFIKRNNFAGFAARFGKSTLSEFMIYY